MPGGLQLISGWRAVNVLHLSQPVEAGVAHSVALLASDQHHHRGWSVSVGCPSSALSDRLSAAGIGWHAWEATRGPGLSTIGEARAVHRIVQKAEPHVVLLHSSKAGLAGRLALRGERPTVFVPHGWSFHATSQLLRRATVAWERAATRWTSAIVCVSERELDDGRLAGIAAEYRVIPNGVDVDRFRVASSDEKQRARSGLGVPTGPPLVVCVARLSVQKGQDVLLDAWGVVRRSHPHALLALVGDGPLRSPLEGRRPDGVIFAGARDDVPAWLSAADLAVLPSRWEGMSYALLEAMAAGLSVVATDVAGSRELLGQSSSAVVPVEGARELAHALIERLESDQLREGEGERNRRIVEHGFSQQRTCDAVADLVSSLTPTSDS